MHCAANQGADGATALFFGLSGTGKTTLSTDPLRKLIGDDEHGWSAKGIFNFEGGCYAKCMKLDGNKEPAIFNAIKAGAIVENTPFFKNTNQINFDSDAITENTRVSYPLSHISNRVIHGTGKAPKHIIFLTCDAFGVLPPLSRLTQQQAIYYFLNGYTAKIAGTEAGIKEPKPTFSACFGAPFMPLAPMVYAGLLQEKLNHHKVKVWMVNTGWAGGRYGVGQRIPLAFSRLMVTAILSNSLDHVSFTQESCFRLNVPDYCPDVPREMLLPRNSWDNQEAYFLQANELITHFEANYQRVIQPKGVIPAGLPMGR